MFVNEGIDHVALAVTDVERSVAWYRDVLGLERRHEKVWGSFPAMVGIGKTMIALFPVQTDNPKPCPDKETLAMRHLAFRTDRVGFSEAQVMLSNKGIEFYFQDHELAHSIYLHDPDGHEIEITTYEV
jgi:catechol 2,3-dioxygenase-like lactoylglutathione lyase family enzyme